MLSIICEVVCILGLAGCVLDVFYLYKCTIFIEIKQSWYSMKLTFLLSEIKSVYSVISNYNPHSTQYQTVSYIFLNTYIGM